MHPNLTIKILIWKVNLLLFWENFNRHDTMNMNESSSDEINLETMLAFACQLTLNIQMVFFFYIYIQIHKVFRQVLVHKIHIYNLQSPSRWVERFLMGFKKYNGTSYK